MATHPVNAAFGGKADMTFCGCLLLRSLLGVERTCLFALQMSAFDPKRTFPVSAEKPLIEFLEGASLYKWRDMERGSTVYD
jgi:hypothetical protein